MKAPSLIFSAFAVLLVLSSCSRKNQSSTSESHPEQQNSNGIEIGKKFVPTVVAPALVHATDHSLTIEGYLELGMPAPDRTWYYTDYKQAVEVLKKVSEDDATKLPRYHGSNSGPLFDRMVSEANSYILTNTSLPLKFRAEAGIEYMQCAKQLLFIYTLPIQKGLVFDDECVEVGRFMLNVMADTVLLADQFFEELPADDPSREGRKVGQNQMKDGATQAVVGLLVMLSDRQNMREPARKRSVISLQKILPVLLPHLSKFTQSDLLSQIQRLTQDEPSNEVKTELQSLANLLSKK